MEKKEKREKREGGRERTEREGKEGKTTVTTVTPSPHEATDGVFEGDGRGDGWAKGDGPTVTEEVAKPSYLADEPGNTSTIKRQMPEAKAKTRPSFDFEPELWRIARANGGRVSLADCVVAGMERGLAEMRLNILAEKAGWTKKKLKSGLMTWWPPAEVIA